MINAGTVGAYLTLDISDFKRNLATAGQMLDSFKKDHSDETGGKNGIGEKVLNALSTPVMAAGEAFLAFAHRFAEANEFIRGNAQITGGVLGGISGIMINTSDSASKLIAKTYETAAGFGNMADSGRELSDAAQTAAGNLADMDSAVNELPGKTRSTIHNAWKGMRDELVNGGSALYSAAKGNCDNIVSVTNDVLGGSSESGGMKGAGNRAIRSLLGGMNGEKPAAIATVKGLMNSMKAAAGTVTFTGIGGNVVSGILRGLNEKKPSLISAAASLALSAAAAAKRALGIHSPSRVMIEVGRFTAEGMELGLKQGSHSLYDTASAISEETAVALSGISSPRLQYSGTHFTGGVDRLDRLLEAVEKLADSQTTMEIDGRSFGRMVREYV